MGILTRQAVLLGLAAGMLTRIPMPRTLPFSPLLLMQSSRYFPLVGMMIGVWAAVLYGGLALVLPSLLASALSLVGTLLLTGAFHEDGLADTCDGMGGGFDRESRLQIMKDSRLGTYGGLGLLLAIMIKVVAVAALPVLVAIPVLVALHGAARACAVSLMFTLSYVRQTNSKVAFTADRTGWADLVITLGFGGIALLLLGPLPAGVLLVFLIGVHGLARLWLYSRLGGYTGDTLGAVEQVAEIGGYLLVLGMLGQGLEVGWIPM